MAAFERLDENGQVVEAVITVDNTHEDNRLGSLALEGKNGWRVAGTAPPTIDKPTPQATPVPPAPQTTRTRKRGPETGE